MSRWLSLLVALSACSALERHPITSKVATLGYSHAPAVIVIGRGPPDVVEAWVAGLRASKQVLIVGELGQDDPVSPSYPPDLCDEAREVADGGAIEEVVLINVVQSATTDTGCKSTGMNTNSCDVSTYLGQRVLVSSTLTAYRASSCKQLRTMSLPVATGVSSDRDPIVPAMEGDDEMIETAKEADLDAAHAAALASITQQANRIPWTTFPRERSIELVEGDKMLVAGPLDPGEYKLKTPFETEMHDGVRVVSTARNLTTLEFDPEHEPQPGDELHRVTDMGRVAAYSALNGGTALAGGEKHVIAGASLAVRYSYDKRPWMGEIALNGELVPGVDTQRFALGGAFGLRLPNRHLSPVAFVEVGAGTAHQGDHGARAVTGYVGAGAGLELWFDTWFLFADMRRRYSGITDWQDSKDHKLEVEYTDRSWTTTQGQLGFGKNF